MFGNEMWPPVFYTDISKDKHLKEQGGSVTKAIQQLQTEPVVTLERIDPTMYNNGYERDYRYPYPQGSRNNFVGNKHRQRRRDDLDVWRPNYDDDDDFDHDNNWHEYEDKGESYRRYGGAHPQQRGNGAYYNDYDYYQNSPRQNYHFGKSRGYPDRSYTSYKWSPMNNRNTNRGGFRKSAPNCTATSSRVENYTEVTSAEKLAENQTNLPCNANVGRIEEAKNKEKESDRVAMESKTHPSTNSLDPCKNPAFLSKSASLERLSVAAKQPNSNIVPSGNSSKVNIDVPLLAALLDIPMDSNDTAVTVDSNFSLTLDSINTRSSFLTKSITNAVDKPQVIEKGCDAIVTPESSAKSLKVCDSNKVCDQDAKRKCENEHSINSIKLDKTKTGDDGGKKISDSANNSGQKSKHAYKKENSKVESKKDKETDLGLSSKRKSISNVDINLPKIPKLTDTQKTESNDNNNNLNTNIVSSKQSEPKDKAFSIEKQVKKRRKTIGDIESPENNTKPKHSQLKDDEIKSNSKKSPKEQQKCEAEHKPTEKATCKKKIVNTEPKAEANPTNVQWESVSDGSKKVPAKIIFRRKTINAEAEAKTKTQPNKAQQGNPDQQSKKVAAKIICIRRSISADPPTEVVAQAETHPKKRQEEEPKKVSAKILLRRKTVDPGCLKTPKKEHRSKSICAQNSPEFEVFHRLQRAKSEGRITRSKSQELGLNLEMLPLPRERGRGRSRAKSVSRTPDPLAANNRKLKGRFKKILETDDDSDASSVSYNSSSSEKDPAKRKTSRKYHIPKIIPNTPLTSSRLNDPRLKKFQNAPRPAHTVDPLTATSVHQQQPNKSRDPPNKAIIANQERVNRPREKKTTLEREPSNGAPECPNREKKTPPNQELPKRLPESHEERRTSLDREPSTGYRKLPGDEKKTRADPPSSEKKKHFITVGQFRNELKRAPPERKYSFSHKMDILFGADHSDDDSANKSPKREPVFEQPTVNEVEVAPNSDINTPSTSGYSKQEPLRICKRKLSLKEDDLTQILKGDDLPQSFKKTTRPWDHGLRSVSNFRENNKKIEHRRSSSTAQACSGNSVAGNTSTGANDINNAKKLAQRRLSCTPSVASTSRVNNSNHVDPRRLSMERRASISSSGNKPINSDSNDSKKLENRRSSNAAPAASISNSTDIKNPEEKQQAITTQVLFKGKQDRQASIIKSLQGRLSTTAPPKNSRESCSVDDKPYQKSYLDHKMKRHDADNKPSTSADFPVQISDRPLFDNSITLNVTNDKNENYIVHMTDKSAKVVRQQRYATDSVLSEFVQETILGLELEVYETKTAHKYRQPKGEKLQKARVNKMPQVEETRLVKQEITKQEKTSQIPNYKENAPEVIDLLSSDDEMDAPNEEIKNVESINNLMREVFNGPIISDTIKPVIGPPAAAEHQPQLESQTFTRVVSKDVTILALQPPLQSPTPAIRPPSNDPVQPQSHVSIPAQAEVPSLTVSVVPPQVNRVKLSLFRRSGSLSSGSVAVCNAPASEETRNIIRNVQQSVDTIAMNLTAVNVNVCNNNQPTTSACNINQPVINNVQPVNTNISITAVAATTNAPNQQPSPPAPAPRQPMPVVSPNDCAAAFAIYVSFHISLLQFTNENYESYRRLGVNEEMLREELLDLLQLPQKSLKRLALKFLRYFNTHQIENFNFKLLVRNLHYYINDRFNFKMSPRMILRVLFEVAALLKESCPTDFTNMFYREMYFMHYTHQLLPVANGIQNIPAPTCQNNPALANLNNNPALANQSNPALANHNNPALANQNIPALPNHNNPTRANHNNPSLTNQKSNAPGLQNANQSHPNPQQQGVPYRPAIGPVEQNSVVVPMTFLQRVQLDLQISEYLRLCVAVAEPAPRANQRRRRRSRPSADLATERHRLNQLLQQRMELPLTRNNEGWRSQSQGTSSSPTVSASAIPAAVATPVAPAVAPNYSAALQMLNQQVAAMVHLETSNNVQTAVQHPTMRWQQDVRSNSLQHTGLAAMDRCIPPNVTISAQQNANVVEQTRGTVVASSTFVPPPSYYQSLDHMQAQRTLEQRLVQPRREEPEAPFPVPNDNFRIRLPMSRPLEPPVAANSIQTSNSIPTSNTRVTESTSVPSTNTMCGAADSTTVSSSSEYPLKQESNTSTQDLPLSPLSVADSLDSVILESVEAGPTRRAPSPTRFIKCEAIEKEQLNLDEWLVDRLVSDGDIGYAVKAELISLQTNTEQGGSDNLPEGRPSTSVPGPPPRIASVDSGISSPPRQMEHPEIMLDRICICSKKAELVCQCKMAIYCSRECQINNWPNHQELCLRTRKEYI